MFDDPTAITEYELEKIRNESRPENVSNGCGCFSLKAFFLFFLGLVIFRIFGELLKFLF